MRFIQKGPEPPALRNWKRENAGLPDIDSFEALTGRVKDELRSVLGREQGALCAYTLTSLDRREGCHIEHVFSQYRHPEKALDHTNMVLCVPENGPCDYGAIAKDDAEVNEGNFVSPLHPNCEARFRYRFNGEVRPTAEEDNAAVSTIELLALNHPILRNARRDAIQSQGIVAPPRERRGGRTMSAAKASRLAETIMLPDDRGRLAAYCIAIKQAAQIYSRQKENRARRLGRNVV